MGRQGGPTGFIDRNWDWLSILTAAMAIASYGWVLHAWLNAAPQSPWWYALSYTFFALAPLQIALLLAAVGGMVALMVRIVLWMFRGPGSTGSH